jgi:hypothetical protein
MKRIRERFGVVIATCVLAAAVAFAFAETAKPETAPSQQKPHRLDKQNKVLNYSAGR